ncbi:MAG: nucleotidyltransferase [Planctomycetota bacterium]
MASDPPLNQALHHVTTSLEEAGIPYMVTGSLASSIHGEPRTTQDIDIVISPTTSTLTKFLNDFAEERFYVSPDAAHTALQQRGMFNIIEFSSGWKIDLIVRKNRGFSLEEFERRLETEFEGMPLTIASPEDVILAKLEWAKAAGSTRQLDDVKSILRTLGNDLDRAYIERWVDELGVTELWQQVNS